MSTDDGYSAMVTMQSWMFLGSFEKLRSKILRNHSISSMAHLGTRAFGAIGGEVVSTTATVFANAKCEVKGAYFRLVDMGSEEEKQAGLLEALANPDCGWFYRANASRFEAIPGSPIAYWVKPNVLKAFDHLIPMSTIASPKQGLATGNNDMFIRHWWEVSIDCIGMDCSDRNDAKECGSKWFPCNKGGGFRKWFGNNELVVNWENDGIAIRSFFKNGKQASRPQNMDWYFKEGITWGTISSADLSMRYSPQGFMFETKGSMCFAKSHDDLIFCLAYTNSSLVKAFMKVLSPTLDYHEGPLGKLPLAIANEQTVVNYAKKSVQIAKKDWDAFEISWDFVRHPLV